MWFVLSLILCLSSCLAMKLETKASMEYTSPDGGNKMFVERSAHSDLDGSATETDRSLPPRSYAHVDSGFIYHSDGTGPANLVKLKGSEVISDINDAYESLLRPIVHGGGAVSDSSAFSAAGAKGDKGYAAFDQFQKGILKKFGQDHEAAFYADVGGKALAHHNQGGYYRGYDEAKKGEQGGKSSEETSHKKGHKTSGYHNVYHKDEYKKEHSFYDESDSNGHYDKYDKGHQSFQKAEGGFKKGDHLDSAYQRGDYGKKGASDKGSFENEEAGFSGAQGKESNFENNQNYGTSNGGHFQKGYGFANDEYEADH